MVKGHLLFGLTLLVLGCTEAEDRFVLKEPSLAFVTNASSDTSGEDLTIDFDEAFSVTLRATGGVAGNRLETLEVIYSEEEPLNVLNRLVLVPDGSIEEFTLPITVPGIFSELSEEIQTTVVYIVTNRRGETASVSFNLTILPGGGSGV